MDEILRPAPDLARSVAEQCSEENWEGIITRVWPNTKYLDVIVTSAMAQYIPTLNYCSGGLPLACTMYASSECYFGLNLNPMSKPSEVSYTIMPNMAYYEFLPHEPNSYKHKKADTSPKLVNLVDIEVGKEYELVIMTYTGLCRYRVGDILRVTGFHNLAPQFHFVRRKNVLLSIDSDKTDESELQKAVENASRILQKSNNTRIVEYELRRYVHDPESLRNLLGITHEGPQELPKQQDGRGMLPNDGGVNELSVQAVRGGGSIGPLEIRVVRNGTFEELMDYWPIKKK